MRKILNSSQSPLTRFFECGKGNEHKKERKERSERDDDKVLHKKSDSKKS